MWEQVTEINEIIFNPNYKLFERIMKSIIYSVKNTTRKAEKIVIIESELMIEELIRSFIKGYDSALERDLEMIHYREPPPLLEMLFYLNILSKHFNGEKCINDEYYFSKVLETLNRESLFKFKELEEIYKMPIDEYRVAKSGHHSENRKKICTFLSTKLEEYRTAEDKWKPSKYDEIEKEMQNLRKYIEEYKPKMQKIVMRNINDGFIDIQESIIFQLGLMI
jgi:hypothetical protein